MLSIKWPSRAILVRLVRQRIVRCPKRAAARAETVLMVRGELAMEHQILKKAALLCGRGLAHTATADLRRRCSRPRPTQCARNFLLIFFWQCGWWCVLAVMAQAQYQVATWTTDNGLPQNTVHSLVQTPDGYLWLATLDGLVRYDGVKFTVFNKNNTHGINSNRFTKLLVDTHGTLWSGTENGDVTSYQQGRFATYTLAAGLHNYPVWNLFLDAAGELVVFASTGMRRWDGTQFVNYAPIAGETQNSVLWWSKNGAFYYSQGLTVHRFQHGTTQDFRLPGSVKDSEKDDAVHDFFEDSHGRLWMGTLYAGLFMLENDTLTNYTIKDGLPDNHISPRLQDRHGNLWAATNKGAVIINNGQISLFTTQQGLPENDLTDIYQDREGNIWAGTFHRGLNRLTRQSVTFYTTQDGLAAPGIYPIFQDRNEDIWLGNSLTRYHAGRFAAVTRPGKPPVQVSAFSQDQRGRLWVGQWGGVLYLENGKFTDFTGKFGMPVSVVDIHQDRHGALWFASTEGLLRYQNDTVTRFTTDDGLPSNDVKVIHESPDGTLWVATYGGLLRIADCPPTDSATGNANGNASNWRLADCQTNIYTTREGLATNHLRALYEDAEGVLWIGSYDGGLARLKDGQLTSYTERDGLFNDGVFQILEDERGNFWMSCNRGIYRVARQQLNAFADGKIARLNSISYGKADGLLETECNGGQQPAGIRARDGKLWFPTQRGVAVIDPNSITTNPYAPPVLLETAKIDGAAVALQDRIAIAAGQNNLEISYTGLSFVKPEAVKFRYKMDGLNADWVEAGTRRTAYYSYLPPGHYVFQVIAANSDGVWNTEGVSVKIVVLPPFYRTWWFWLLSGALTGSVVAGFFRWRVTQLKREQAAQQAYSQQLIEAQERERKRIASELHDGLGQSLVVIKNRALMSLNTPDNHERLLAQMENISEAASATIAEVRGIARALHPYQIEYLGLTTALQTMLDAIADASDLTVDADLDELAGVLTPEAEVNLYRIVQEALNNVIKHAAATQVSVSLKKNGDILALLIKDNGCGFVPTAPRPTPGLGLVGLSERAKMLAAHYEMRSAVGQGTAISLQMKLN